MLKAASCTCSGGTPLLREDGSFERGDGSTTAALIRTQRGRLARRGEATGSRNQIPLTPIQLCAERCASFGAAPSRAPARGQSTTIVGEVESLKELVDEFRSSPACRRRGSSRRTAVLLGDTLAR